MVALDRMPYVVSVANTSAKHVARIASSYDLRGVGVVGVLFSAEGGRGVSRCALLGWSGSWVESNAQGLDRPLNDAPMRLTARSWSR